jgi:hypothetical protein
MLLHPALKTRFMRRAGYGPESIDQYVKEAKSRYQRHYDPPDLTRQHFQSRPTPRGGKRRRPVDSSDSDSSDGMEYNEFSSYMQIKRDSPVKDALPWWKGSQTLYPKLTKMVRDVFAVPAMGAGVEREFSISGTFSMWWRKISATADSPLDPAPPPPVQFSTLTT